MQKRACVKGRHLQLCSRFKEEYVRTCFCFYGMDANISSKQSVTCSVYNSLELKKNILNKKKIICGASDSYSHGAKGLGFATKFGK